MPLAVEFISDQSASLMSMDARLSVKLNELLDTPNPEITLGELIEKVGDKGFGLLLLLLSLPSALPVPAAGYSVPFGIVLLVLSVQMIIGKSTPVFPERLRRLSFSKKTSAKMISGSSWIFRKIEWFVRPRMAFVLSGGGRVIMGAFVFIMALLMMIPIPLTNTAPAIVIFVIGVSLTEEDGLFGALSLLFALVAVALYAGLIYAIIVHGPEVVTTIKETIYSWF